MLTPSAKKRSVLSWALVVAFAAVAAAEEAARELQDPGPLEDNSAYVIKIVFSLVMFFALVYIFACMSWSAELDPVLLAGLKKNE